jgi:hypothetical protein
VGVWDVLVVALAVVVFAVGMAVLVCASVGFAALAVFAVPAAAAVVGRFPALDYISSSS